LLLVLLGARLWLFGALSSADLMDKHLNFSLLWAFFVLLLVDSQGLTGRLLCNRGLSFLGSIS
jgi:peptidoglycan/LPS O-acetylase OafA/YrhL